MLFHLVRTVRTVLTVSPPMTVTGLFPVTGRMVKMVSTALEAEVVEVVVLTVSGLLTYSDRVAGPVAVVVVKVVKLVQVHQVAWVVVGHLAFTSRTTVLVGSLMIVSPTQVSVV